MLSLCSKRNGDSALVITPNLLDQRYLHMLIVINYSITYPRILSVGEAMYKLLVFNQIIQNPHVIPVTNGIYYISIIN